MRRASLPAGFLICAAIALPALALVFGLPAHPVLFGVLNNFAHGPLFGLMAVLVALLLRNRVNWSRGLQYAGAFSVAVLVAGLVELIQPSLGRDRALHDWLISGIGAAGGIAALALADTPRRWLPGSVLAISIAAISWPLIDAGMGYVEKARQAPALLELSGRSDWYFLSFDGFLVSPSELPHRWRRTGDPSSLHLKLTGEPRNSISHMEPLANWSNYRWLMVDMTNAGLATIDFTLRVHDRKHNNQASDRFNRNFQIEPATRSVLAIPLTEIVRAPHGRTLDIADIAGLMIFAGTDAALTRREFYLTRVWLE